MAANRTGKTAYRSRERDYGAYRSNLAYDFDALERRRAQETPQKQPRIRTISRPKVQVRPAERVSVSAVLGFAAVAVMLVLVLAGYAHLTALSDSVVSLQSELSALQTENVTLTTAYERTFDLETVESAAEAAGMSKPSHSQIYYLNLETADSASVYATQSSTAQKLFSAIGAQLKSIAEYFA